jgi:hypothetical protein
MDFRKRSPRARNLLSNVATVSEGYSTHNSSTSKRDVPAITIKGRSFSENMWKFALTITAKAGKQTAYVDLFEEAGHSALSAYRIAILIRSRAIIPSRHAFLHDGRSRAGYPAAYGLPVMAKGNVS